MVNNLHQLASAICERDTFLLVGHVIPDGDCIGSLLGLYLGLKSIHKQAWILLQDPVPETYMYLTASDEVLYPHDPIPACENVIYVDCSELDRCGEAVKEITSACAFAICIDHHGSNVGFADYNYVDVEAAASAEIIYQLLLLLEVDITAAIANALYAGLVQDTGSFRHATTSPRSFRIAAQLLECGVDLEKTKIQLFESKTRAEILLLARALEGLQFSQDGRIAWMTLSQEAIKSAGAENLHPEGIINYTLMVKEVEVGLLFREIEPGFIKVGFRSKKGFDVAEFAKHFGGGGHKLAAGASVQGSMQEVQQKVLDLLVEVMG